MQLEHGVARADAYITTMNILACLLVLSYVYNWLVKLVAEQRYMSSLAFLVAFWKHGLWPWRPRWL